MSETDTIEIDPEVMKRVKAGSAWLTARKQGWYQRVNVDHLMMSNGLYCVLGQTYGSYGAGLGVLLGDDEAAVAYGFIEDIDEPDYEDRADVRRYEDKVGDLYAMLDAAWTNEIFALRAADRLQEAGQS